MTDELRPCPFCGSKDNHGNEDIYDPFDNACFMSTPGTNIRKLWNTRPIEDAMQTKLDIAVEAMRYALNDPPVIFGAYYTKKKLQEALTKLESK